MTAKPADQADGAVEVMVVCLANQARSVAAATLLEQKAAAAGELRVASGGLDVPQSQPMLSEMVNAMERRGITPPVDHRSRAFSIADVSREGVIVTMQRDQTKQVVVSDPSRVATVFTLRELQRLTRSPHFDPTKAGLPQVLRHLHTLRPLVDPGDDDIPDPARDLRRCDKILDQIIEAVEQISGALFSAPAAKGV